MPVEYGDDEAIKKFEKLIFGNDKDSVIVREILDMSMRTYSVLFKQCTDKERMKANNLGFRIFELIEREREREDLPVSILGLAVETFYINWHLNLLKRLDENKNLIGD